MSGAKTNDGAERAARRAKALRDNLRRRKGQAKTRDDLSGLDPKRTDTPLNRPNETEDDTD